MYRDAFAALAGGELPELLRVDPAYRVFFDGDGSLDLLYDEAAMAAQLERVEAGAGEKYRALLARSTATLDMGMALFIERNIRNLAEMLDVPKLLGALPKLGGSPLDLLLPFDRFLSRYFESPKLRALFTFQTLYVGLSPFTAPAAFQLLAATELRDGVFYPAGGFGRVAIGLRMACEAAGVEIATDTEVQRIVEADGAVRGVELGDGSVVEADLVLCNQDLPSARRRLLGREARPGWAYSAGVIAWCWGVDGAKLDALPHHSVFLSADWNSSWERPGTREKLPGTANFYVHRPNVTDPSAAPAGGDSVMVLLPVAHRAEKLAKWDYAELAEWGRETVLAQMRAAGAAIGEGDIVEESVRTPDDWESLYALEHGAAFGLAHPLQQLGYFRPANKDARTDGLYYVGASTHPGNGVPLCLISAKLAVERVLEDL